jgi:hypothetical protein
MLMLCLWSLWCARWGVQCSKYDRIVTMKWLGQIRSHRRDETWSASLCQTFFSTSMGAQIPVIAEKPLAVCGCRKFQIDPLV